MKRTTLGAAVLLLILISACCPCRKSASSSQPIALEGSEWKLVQLNNKSLEGGSASPYSIIFGEDGQLSGEMSCNRLIGNYNYESTRSITLKPMGMTMMACPDDTHTNEWRQAMESATHFELDGQMLMLLSEGEVIAVLRAVER